MTPRTVMEEAQLAADLEGALAGAPDAREAVARRALTLALRTARGLFGGGSDASDVAQEVAVDVMRTLEKLREPAAFDAWVHRITVRKTMRALRSRRLRLSLETPIEDERLDAGDPDPTPAPAERLALEEATRRALAKLPTKQRVAVVLRYLHDLSEAQIADAMGCAPGTAGSLLSRARRQLRADPELQAFVSPEGVTS